MHPSARVDLVVRAIRVALAACAMAVALSARSGMPMTGAWRIHGSAQQG
jgi:hypothetical protein